MCPGPTNTDNMGDKFASKSYRHLVKVRGIHGTPEVATKKLHNLFTFLPESGQI